MTPVLALPVGMLYGSAAAAAAGGTWGVCVHQRAILPTIVTDDCGDYETTIDHEHCGDYDDIDHDDDSYNNGTNAIGPLHPLLLLLLLLHPYRYPLLLLLLSFPPALLPVYGG
eukprot:GHVU01128590.1.p2 GENE.GHVU01128590.1~~GHVU01128590.1.p2  ORF type:complete len:113 (-),score=24.45 GHVU01128590.1:585-923(-)